ncbi:hypothetical protein HDU84_007197 [Entophlyctis sp. JEL0112]|nr:hypothetical protein HDU84_007197 [Entophlyctis sp. JEL0112]
MNANDSESAQQGSPNTSLEQIPTFKTSQETVIDIADKGDVQNAKAGGNTFWTRHGQKSPTSPSATREMQMKIKTKTKQAVKSTKRNVKTIFKDFASFMGDGRITEYAIGMVICVIGTAFTNVINSLVTDVISPFIGLAIGSQLENFYIILKGPETSVCLKNASLCVFHTVDDAHNAGAVTWNVGLFMQTVLNFFMIAFALFMVVKFLKSFITSTMIQLRTLKSASKSLGSLNTLFRKKELMSRELNLDDTKHCDIRVSEIKTSDRLRASEGENMRRSVSDSKIILNVQPSTPILEKRPETGATFVDSRGIAESGSHSVTIGDHFCEQDNPTKECPYCCSVVPSRANRCAHCTATFPVPNGKENKDKDNNKDKIKFEIKKAPFRIN